MELWNTVVVCILRRSCRGSGCPCAYRSRLATCAGTDAARTRTTSTAQRLRSLAYGRPRFRISSSNTRVRRITATGPAWARLKEPGETMKVPPPMPHRLVTARSVFDVYIYGDMVLIYKDVLPGRWEYNHMVRPQQPCGQNLSTLRSDDIYFVV